MSYAVAVLSGATSRHCAHVCHSFCRACVRRTGDILGMVQARLSACMLIPHKGHTDTIQVYSVTVMTHIKALQAGHSSQGTSEPITPAIVEIALPTQRKDPYVS